jgi:sulfotransferase
MKIHFISGLPRSGSTLLAGILRQNPRFHAAITTPLADMFAGLIRSMSGFTDTSIFISDDQRRRVLTGVIEAYYAHLTGRVVFDTGRGWTALAPAITGIFPDARIICCVRNPAWIIDSIEMHVHRNPFNAQRMFNFEAKGNVYTRAELLTGKDGLVRRSLGNLRQAWFSECAARLIAVRYESLVSEPGGAIAALYDALGERRFAHDFTNVEYDEPQFDAGMGLAGFHRVSGPVRINHRESILPPDLFRQHNESFWDTPGQNPRGVVMI